MKKFKSTKGVWKYNTTPSKFETLNYQYMTHLNTSTEITQTTEPAIAVEPVLAPVFVYEFLYNSDCCESAASTISIHKTKKGAEMAMEFHKNEKLKEWEKECKEYPPAKEYPFDFDQWWGVRECELLP